VPPKTVTTPALPPDLERAYEDHALEFVQWKHYPVFARADVDPRYQQVLRRVIGQ